MSGHPYRSFVKTFETAIRKGRNLPLGGFESLPPAPAGRKAPLAMILSPHPDDECIVGALTLRLMRQAGWRVLNVAITLGSHRERRKGRWQELQNACRFLGFDVTRVVPGGLDKINPKGRTSDPENWAAAVAALAAIIQKKKPRAIFFPHLRDWNGTHIGTGMLAREALAKTDYDGFIVETEFWGAMDAPNLMVECRAQEVGDMCAALSFHVKEVERNPYHLSLPAWMMDNVRRGGEVVGGQGGAAPDFAFATLFRVARWIKTKEEPAWAGGRFLSADDNPNPLFGS